LERLYRLFTRSDPNVRRRTHGWARLVRAAQRTKVVGTDFGRRTNGGERFRRCDEEASDFAGRLLEAPGGVHDVAMEDDRTAHLADLPGDDLA
jgi:hypothetical protein